MNRRRKGFTLIELMVVVVILGILAVVAIQAFGGRAEKAKHEATKAILSKIAEQIDMFKLDHGKYPAKLEDLFDQPSYVKPKNWPQGGYVKKKAELRDAWDNDLVYRQPGTADQPYDLISFGADGTEGGEQFDEDIWNHDKGGR